MNLDTSARDASARQSAEPFPAEWYVLAPEDHFWMEWRLKVILRQLRRFGLDRDAALRGFDIGCGHGVFQRQVHRMTAWTVDGCDLNEEALSLNRGHDGQRFLYNIFDFRPDLHAAYDLVFLLDVIEHVPQPVEFLSAARFYLKPGGYLVVNVPAVPRLYSKYDVVAGHIRRYSRRSLVAEISAAGISMTGTVHWGLSLVPLVLLRKFLSAFAADDALIRRGFVPPGKTADRLLRLFMSAELAAAADVPYGTSLLAVAREAGQ